MFISISSIIKYFLWHICALRLHWTAKSRVSSYAFCVTHMEDDGSVHNNDMEQRERSKQGSYAQLSEQRKESWAWEPYFDRSLFPISLLSQNHHLPCVCLEQFIMFLFAIFVWVFSAIPSNCPLSWSNQRENLTVNMYNRWQRTDVSAVFIVWQTKIRHSNESLIWMSYFGPSNWISNSSSSHIVSRTALYREKTFICYLQSVWDNSQ